MIDWNQDDKRRIKDDRLAERKRLQDSTYRKEREEHPVPSGAYTRKEVADKAFLDAVARVFESNAALLVKKHKDYGPTNISQSPGGPLNGLRVRMWDKIARINNLLESGATPQNESLEDSFRDLMNYSAIAILVIQGDWPEK